MIASNVLNGCKNLNQGRVRRPALEWGTVTNFANRKRYQTGVIEKHPLVLLSVLAKGIRYWRKTGESAKRMRRGSISRKYEEACHHYCRHQSRN